MKEIRTKMKLGIALAAVCVAIFAAVTVAGLLVLQNPVQELRAASYDQPVVRVIEFTGVTETETATSCTIQIGVTGEIRGIQVFVPTLDAGEISTVTLRLLDVAGHEVNPYPWADVSVGATSDNGLIECTPADINRYGLLTASRFIIRVNFVTAQEASRTCVARITYIKSP